MSIALYKRHGVPSMFRDVFGEDFFAPRYTAASDCWTPAVDIREAGETLTFHFELPGVSKENIKLEYKDGVLALTGEKKEEEAAEGVRYYARERCAGTFSRSFRIGTAYDPSSVEAKFKDGILTVTVQKKEEARPLSITVQ